MTINQKSIHETHLVEFEYDGHACLRFLIRAEGFVSLVRTRRGRACLAMSPSTNHTAEINRLKNLGCNQAETDMNKKLHAILHLLEEHKEHITQGIGDGPDLVMKVLNSSASGTQSSMRPGPR